MAMTTKRWLDSINILIGVWLFASPWLLDYAASAPNAAANAYIVGAVIVLFAAGAVYLPKVWEEWVNMACGIWMILSPWALGFAGLAGVTRNAVIVGVLVTVLATWAMLRDRDFEKWWQDRHAAH